MDDSYLEEPFGVTLELEPDTRVFNLHGRASASMLLFFLYLELFFNSKLYMKNNILLMGMNAFVALLLAKTRSQQVRFQFI